MATERAIPPYFEWNRAGSATKIGTATPEKCQDSFSAHSCIIGTSFIYVHSFVIQDFI